jgi:hypothetical protein
VQYLDASNPADAVLLRMPDTESEWNDGKENDEIEMTKLEGMTKDREAVCWLFGLCRAGAARKRIISCRVILMLIFPCRVILMLIFQTCSIGLTQAQSPNVIGRWNVEITFANDNHRSLRFDAQAAGKGTFLLLDPKLKVWGPAKPSEAKWSRGEGNSVTFSGPVEFMIGNVGRDAGTLVFKGKFETESLITGEVEFSPLVGDGPSKSGTFKAVRAGDG